MRRDKNLVKVYSVYDRTANNISKIRERGREFV